MVLHAGVHRDGGDDSNVEKRERRGGGVKDGGIEGQKVLPTFLEL